MPERFAFNVIDSLTGEVWGPGEAPGPEVLDQMGLGKQLVYCDLEGFALQSDGTLILCDECGNFGYVDENRFKVYLHPQEQEIVFTPDGRAVVEEGRG